MTAVDLSFRAGVHELRIANAARDNTFDMAALDAWMRALDTVEASSGDSCLLIWSDHPKTFCNGIDLEWMLAQPPADILAFVRRLEDLFLRIALLPLPTLAAINGNAYGGGAILATACDFRVMRADRGRFCYPEVRIRKAFTPAMIEVIRLLPNPRALNRLALTADAIGGEEALALGVVDAIHPAATLLDEARRQAEILAGKHRPTYTEIKHMLRADLARYAAARSGA